MGLFDKLFGKKQEKEWSFYANRANTYWKQRQFTEAIADYTQAIALPKQEFVGKLTLFTKTLIQLKYSRGRCYYERGLNTHSIDDLTHAIEDLEVSKIPGSWFEPQRWAMVTLMCADASFEIGDYDKAAKYYTELLQRWIGIAEFLPMGAREEHIKRKRDIAERKLK